MAFDRIAAIFVGGALGFFQALVLFLVALSVGAARPGPGQHRAGRRATPPPTRCAARRCRHTRSARSRWSADAVAPLVTSDLTTHLEDGTQVALHF